TREAATSAITPPRIRFRMFRTISSPLPKRLAETLDGVLDESTRRFVAVNCAAAARAVVRQRSPCKGRGNHPTYPCREQCRGIRRGGVLRRACGPGIAF